MRYSIFFLAGYFSAVYAASGTRSLLSPPLQFQRIHRSNIVLPVPATDANSDLTSILEALRANNPEDAEAAASVMKIKLRRRDPEPASSTSDLNSILAALEANNPEDAAAARQNAKRQDDLSSILAALEENSPEDAAAAKQVGGSISTGNANGNVRFIGNGKRQDDLSSILAALEENNPEDAAAAAGSGGLTAVA